MHLDLVSLEIFLRAVESKSLSKAADQSHITLSAASRRIMLLESQLNVKLLDRTPRGMSTTPAGNALVFHARLMLKESERLKADLSDYAKGLRGIVRILANTSSLSQFLPYDLASFAVQCPDIKLEVQERLSSEILRGVQEGIADVGIAFPSPTNADRLRCHPYKVDHLVAVMPQSYKLDTKHLRLVDLLDLDLVVLESNTAMLKLLEEAAENEGKTLKLRVQVKSFEAICKMIHAGLGVGILPKVAAETFGHELELRFVELADTWATRQMYICVRDEANPISVERLVEHLLIKAASP